jgi:hypothetical protein
MHHKQSLINAAKIIDERAQQYGAPDTCFEKISRIATAVTGEAYTEYDIALIMHCVKLGRMLENRKYEDNYIDAINYLAFAGQFAGNPTKPGEVGLTGVSLPGSVTQFSVKKGGKGIPLDLDALEEEIVTNPGE